MNSTGYGSANSLSHLPPNRGHKVSLVLENLLSRQTLLVRPVAYAVETAAH